MRGLVSRKRGPIKAAFRPCGSSAISARCWSGMVQWSLLTWKLPSGEQPHSNGKSPFLLGKSTITMAIFNCYVSSLEGTVNSNVGKTMSYTPTGNGKFILPKWWWLEDGLWFFYPHYRIMTCFDYIMMCSAYNTHLVHVVWFWTFRDW